MIHLLFLLTALANATGEIEEKESVLGSPELLLELLMLVIVGGIVYNLWGTITTFGGKIGEALKLIGLGVLLFSFEAVDKVLEHFELDFVERTLSHTGEEIFHDVLKVTGLFFLAWGLSKLSKIYASK